MKMIAKNPEDRYASLDDLAEDIESVRRQFPDAPP